MKYKPLQWLYRLTGRSKLCIGALVFLEGICGMSGVLYALLLRGIVDSAAQHDISSFWRHSIHTIVLTSVLLVFWAIIRWLDEFTKATVENLLKQHLTEKLLHKDYASVTSIHTGEWMNRLTNDTAIVAGSFTELLPSLVGTVIRLTSALFMLVALDRRFAIILVPCGLAMAALTYLLRGTMKRLHKNVREQDGALRIFLQEHLGSLLVIKSFTAERQTAEMTAGKLQAHKSARMRKLNFSNLCHTGFSGAMQGAYLAVVIYCAYGILQGTTSYGTLMAIMQLVGQVQYPFASISGYISRYYVMIASVERLKEVEAYDDDGLESVKGQQEIHDFYENQLASFGMESVDFSYPVPPDTPHGTVQSKRAVVLEDLSLDIPKGSYVAFTGNSGCGKSTVLKLLMCMYPLDGGGRYLKTQMNTNLELTMAWRRLFAYVPQGNHLLRGSIREVIALSDERKMHDDDNMLKAMKIACADDFLSQLKEGLDTELGEHGTGLSEGQMQRLAIARAIFTDRPVLLLDEATSALDEQTEKQLLTNLRALTDKTVIIVTHRPAALSICDIVLKFNGKGTIEK